MPIASLGDSLRSFSDAVNNFFDSLGAIHWAPLLLGMACFGIYLTLRSRAYFNVLRAAYPTEHILFRNIWAAYVAAYGFNNVVPARGGDVIKLFLSKISIPNSSYATVAAAFVVEGVFDLTIGICVLAFAFSQGVFPKPPDFSQINAFDLQFFAGNPRFTLFLLTVVAVLVLVLFAVLSRRVKAFWARMRQGVTILFDRRRYIREVWLAVRRLAVPLRRVLVPARRVQHRRLGGERAARLGVNAVAAVVPFTPGGAGVQQALLVQVFGTTAAAATVASYSVGQQVAIAVFSITMGFAALVIVFRITSFKEVIRRGKEDRTNEKAKSSG